MGLPEAPAWTLRGPVLERQQAAPPLPGHPAPRRHRELYRYRELYCYQAVWRQYPAVPAMPAKAGSEAAGLRVCAVRAPEPVLAGWPGPLPAQLPGEA